MESQNNTTQNIDSEVTTKQNTINAFSKRFMAGSTTLVIVVTFCALFFIDPYLPSPLSNYKKGHTSGFNDAKKVVASSNFGKMFSTQEEVHTLTGSVVSVGNNQLSVRIESMDPFQDTNLTQRTVLISPSTKLYRLVPKDAKQFQAELKAYFDPSKISKENTTRVAPKKFIEQVINLKDIKVGNPLEITSPENISALSVIPASEIRVQSQSTK